MTTKKIIKDTYSVLKSQQDLSPANALISMHLSSLVKALSEDHMSGNKTIELAPELSKERMELPSLCGQAECEMEKYWSRFFTSNKNLEPNTLKKFWYYDNYKKLWQIEQSLVENYVHCERVVFLGSGALPLTVIIAALEDPDLRAVCIDFDVEACKLARDLISRLDLGDQINVIHSCAQEFNYKSTDFIICASLISGKEQLYKVLHKSGVKAFAVRDAEGPYCYLYAPSPLPETYHYQEVGRTSPASGCINTTRLFTINYLH